MGLKILGITVGIIIAECLSARQLILHQLSPSIFMFRVCVCTCCALRMQSTAHTISSGATRVNAPHRPDAQCSSYVCVHV